MLAAFDPDSMVSCIPYLYARQTIGYLIRKIRKRTALDYIFHESRALR